MIEHASILVKGQFAMRIIRCWRLYISRKRFKLLKAKTIKIQAFWRMIRARRAFRKKRNAVTQLNKIVRGYLVIHI